MAIMKNNKKEEVAKKAYDEEHKIEKLKVFCIIVNRYQSDFYVKKFDEIGVGASFVILGTGTATKDIYDFLGIGETKKDIILSLVKESVIPELKKITEERFKVSKNAKGVAFSFEMDSIAGVLAYRFIAGAKEKVKKDNNSKLFNKNLPLKDKKLKRRLKNYDRAK